MAVLVVRALCAESFMANSVTIVVVIASFAHQSIAAGTSSNALDSWLHGSKRSELGGKVHPAVGELLEWREGNSVLVCAQVDWSHRRMRPFIELDSNGKFNIQ